MRTQKVAAAALFTLATALTPIHIHAFTAQLPISGYEFASYLHIHQGDVGSLDSVYTVPEGRLAVVTDIYVALDSGATGTHKTFVSNNLLQRSSGPFRVTGSAPFSRSYTSGIPFFPGEQIIVSDTGGTGNVVVTINGYLVCPEACE
jgi:hypothetical protein